MDENEHLKRELNSLINDIGSSGKTPRSNYEMVHNREIEEYDTSSEFADHNNKIRNQIITEFESKRKFRKASYVIIVTFAFLLLIFIGTFLFLKSDKAHLSLLLTLTVATFGNLSTLFIIIFRYVFSPTTELTDYAKYLLKHEDDNGY